MTPTTTEQPPSTALTPAPPAAPPEKEPVPRFTPEQAALIPDLEKRTVILSALADIELARRAFSIDQAWAQKFTESEQFAEIKGRNEKAAIATAMVKIALGRSWGFSQADSMSSIYFVNGRPAVMNDLIADKLYQAGIGWDVEFIERTVTDEKTHLEYERCEGCRLWLKRFNYATRQWEEMLDRKKQPVSVAFTEHDARTAGLFGKKGPWEQYPRDMYYWRCIGRVKRYHAPNILRGAVSLQEELERINVAAASPDQIPADVARTLDAAAPQRPLLRDHIMAQPPFMDLTAEPAPPPAPDPTPPSPMETPTTEKKAELACDACASTNLEPVAGSFGTSVWSPDGVEETHWQEGWRCLQCGAITDCEDEKEDDPRVGLHFSSHDRSTLTRRLVAGEQIHSTKAGWRYQLQLLPPDPQDTMAARVKWGVCIQRKWCTGLARTTFDALLELERSTRREDRS